MELREKSIRITGFLMFLAAVFLAALCFTGGSSQLKPILSSSDDITLLSDWELTDRKVVPAEGAIAIRRLFHPEDFIDSRFKNILFRTQDLDVCIQIDGEDFHRCDTASNSSKGTESGNMIHSIEIPCAIDKPYELYMEFYPSFKAPEGTEEFFALAPKNVITPKIFFGTKDRIVMKAVREILPKTILSLVIIACGLGGIILSIAVRLYKKRTVRTFYYFSVFTFTIGIEFLIEGGFFDFFMENTFFMYFMSSLIIAMLPFPFMNFSHYMKTIPMNEGVSRFFRGLAVFNGFIVCAGAFIPYIPFSFIRKYVIAVYIIQQFFVITVVLGEGFTFSKKLPLSIMALTVVCAALITDLIFTLAPPGSMDLFRFTRPCYLAYIVIVWFTIAENYYSSFMLEKRKDMYAEFISRDPLTKVQSHVVFWKSREKFYEMASGGKKLLLVLFRVENFIHVAEEHGFENANINLKVTVDCLKEQFGERDLYRLSESIFAVFSPDLTINDAEEKIKAVKKFENNYNDNPNLIDIRTRCVIVKYDRESYRNLESFIGKAVKKVEADS